MAGKNTAAFGIYRSRSAADEGVTTIRHNGFRIEDISLLMPENFGSKDLATEKASKAPEGAATGGGAGAAIGGTLGLLAGIGVLAIPGLGPFIAAGPIMATLAGIGAGGAVGGLLGALVGAGVPEYEAKRYEGRMRSGGILVSVHCDNNDWAKKAKTLLERTGAEDISSAAQSSADYAETDRPLPRAATTTESLSTQGGYREYEDDFRAHYRQKYGSGGAAYEDYSPAYAFGCEMANNPRYRGRVFSEVEPSLRRDYEGRYPGSRWERVKDSVRYGWDRLMARSRGAGR
jgi:hypothetical protein